MGLNLPGLIDLLPGITTFGLIGGIVDFFTEDVGGVFSDAIDFFENIGDNITNAFQSAIDYVVSKLLYDITSGLCQIVYYLDQMYKVFSGQQTVKYDGKSAYLMDVFVGNHTVNNVYWGFALLGVVLAFAMAIIAVARKMFDGRDKDQRSLGQILGSLAKSLLLILSMNAIMVVTLAFSNVLMQQITFIFDYGEVLDKQWSIDFTDEQYAAMGRCLNTIANYSLNDSSSSIYNINACFNKIRPDLNYLSQQGVFDFYYVTEKNGETVDTWQSVLQEIAHSANLQRDLKADVYYESVSNSVKKAMVAVNTNRNLRPLSHYDRQYKVYRASVPLDRYVFLLGTFSAAKNPQYNVSPELTDGVRGPYYYGEKNIYNFNEVRGDFNLSPSDYDYLITILVVIAMIWNLAIIIFSCISRIFMMLLLYIIGPLFFAIEPLDDGEKRKQWTTAFVVQTFSVMGTVVAMRVLLLFIPIVISSKLVLFESSVMNYLSKTALIVGGFLVAKKASGVITGILANNAGMQSISQDATAYADSIMQAPVKLAGMAIGVATGIGSLAAGGGGGGGGGGGAGGDFSVPQSGGSSGQGDGGSSGGGSSGGSLPESYRGDE